MDDPTGYGRVDPQGRRAGVRASSSSATPLPTSSTSTRSTRRSTLPPRPARAGAAQADPRQRPGRVLPHRRGPVLGRHGAPHRRGAGAGRRDPGRQRPLAARARRARAARAPTAHWLLNGVTMLDPRQTFVDVTVTIGRDVTLYPGTILQGRTVVGDGSEIGPDTRLVDCVVGAGRVVEHTVGHDAEIGDGGRRRPVRPSAAGSQRRCGGDDRRLLHCTRSAEAAPRSGRTHSSWRRSPPSDWPCTRGAPTRSWPRRWRRTSASSWATPTSSSSPTARSTAASASRSAAPTSSSSRPTTASTTIRSTTRSWSS